VREKRSFSAHAEDGSLFSEADGVWCPLPRIVPLFSSSRCRAHYRVSFFSGRREGGFPPFLMPAWSPPFKGLPQANCLDALLGVERAHSPRFRNVLLFGAPAALSQHAVLSPLRMAGQGVRGLAVIPGIFPYRKDERFFFCRRCFVCRNV